jgi:hypothetical protein
MAISHSSGYHEDQDLYLEGWKIEYRLEEIWVSSVLLLLLGETDIRSGQFKNPDMSLKPRKQVHSSYTT